MDSMPPPRRASSAGEPVVILRICLRFSTTSLPVMNTDFSILRAASMSFYTFASLMPLILQSSFLVAIQTLATVHIPAALSLAMSAALMPCSCSLSISEKFGCSMSSTSSSSMRLLFCIRLSMLTASELFEVATNQPQSIC